MIHIHYDFTDGTEVSYAEGLILGDNFNTCCLDFFNFDIEQDVIIIKRDGSKISKNHLLENTGCYTKKEIRKTHDIQKMFKANTFNWYSTSIHPLDKEAKEIDGFVEFYKDKLDKNIIESHGLKYDENHEEYISNKTFFGISCADDKKLHIFYSPEDYFAMSIYYKSKNGSEYVVFDGYDIKNNSDFSDLLYKKLRIKLKK